MATQIAAQLYTLREFEKTPADIAKTLKKVREIGYEAVQVSGMGPIDPKELAKILKGEGLACCATHVPLTRMQNEAQKLIEEHEMWGCKYTAIGGFFKDSFVYEDWQNFVQDYNKAATNFAGSSLSIGYHNHSHEFMNFNGKVMMQKLVDELAKDIWIEFDTYWVQHGGGDPAAWIRKVKGRIPCVHLKDMAVLPTKQIVMAEVGEGNLNWPEILKACKEAGVQWYIIEQDVCQRDPFDSLKISLENVKKMGLK